MTEERGLLRADQVGHLLGVDRSTVYRMAESGRLPAIRVGRQWRFSTEVITGLLSAGTPGATTSPDDRQTMARVVEATLPLIDLAARILGVMMITTDMDGQPMGELINPPPWIAEHAHEPDFVSTCLDYWKQLADDPDFEVGFHIGPLDVACARTFIRVGPRLVGMLFAGGIEPNAGDERALHRLSEEGRTRVLTFLPTVAAAISRLAAGPELGSETRSAP